MLKTDTTVATADNSIGRIVSVTGSKAIAMLDQCGLGNVGQRPEMGTLFAIETPRAVVLAIVSGLSIPVPAQRHGDSEFWMAELGLVGELSVDKKSGTCRFSRGTTAYPALGDRVRVASRSELQIAFNDTEDGVRIGTLQQDSSITAMIAVDDLLGKHFAVLGTTGTGKSCTAALILRAILKRNAAAHIVMLDPHNEYATAFSDMAEIISPRTLQLPLWLLNFEETVEILVGDPERKAEIEILAELIPVAKARFATGRGNDANRLRRSGVDLSRCAVDTPIPYRVQDLLALIDERMGRLEHKRDLPPYRQLKNRLEQISSDHRYSFLFGALTVSDDMAQVLGRLFRVPVEDKPVTIIELTGLPTEVVNVVVAVLCRLTFEFALWSDGQVPVTLVCEEAHRFIPANPAHGFEPCRRAISKIAKEGRKYGASLCILTQRPSDVDPTVLSQCNTVFALRMSNERDQSIVSSAIADTSLGLVDFLPALGQREAIAFGDGVALPVRILFDELPAHAMPRSATARFSEHWKNTTLDISFMEAVVERWRNAEISRPAETSATLSKELAAVQSALQDDDATGEFPRSTMLRAAANAMQSSLDRSTEAPQLPAHQALRERLLRQPRS